MKALAVLPKSGMIEVVDHPEPPPIGPHDVALRMIRVGICGTDREIARRHYGAPPPGSDYLVIGHEALGEVIETGVACSRFRPGDLAVPQVRRPCPVAGCAPCRNGYPDFCITGKFTERGILRAHGFMTERVIEAESYLHLVPSALREVGVLAEPLSIAEKALGRMWDMARRPRWTDSPPKALVLGAGPVGLLGAMALRLEGSQVVVYSRESRSHPKASITEGLGGIYVSAEECLPDQLPARNGPFDLVYEATGAARTAFKVLEVLDPNAIFIFTGVPGRKAPIELEAARFMRRLVLRNQVIFGSVNAGYEAFERATAHLERALRRWPAEVSGLISGLHSLSSAPLLLTERTGGIKDVVLPQSGY